MSAVFSDAEEDEEEAPQLNSFAKRLTKYQKSPSKSKSRGTLVSHLYNSSCVVCPSLSRRPLSSLLNHP